MISAAAVLALVAGILFLISLFPQVSTWPMAGAAGLILSVAVFLIAYK